jgi:hypothetical protein
VILDARFKGGAPSKSAERSRRRRDRLRLSVGLSYERRHYSHQANISLREIKDLAGVVLNQQLTSRRHPRRQF